MSRASQIARSILPDTDFMKREPHHTEAQIAAKEAAGAGKKGKGSNHRRQEADEFGPWDSTEGEFGSWLDKREPHHTEAQIAAKEAAGKGKGNKNNKRHHTEAQIAAKEAAAKKKNHNRSPQEADEFGPWDSTEDEFGSWLDKREPHHTEAQIAAKEAAGKGKGNKNHKRHHTEAQIAAKEAAAKKKNHNRSPQEADEFGPWDSTEDEFGSWLDKREPHHTEAQIAAKEAAGKGKGNKNNKRHHTEAQIAAKEAAKSGKGGKTGHN